MDLGLVTEMQQEIETLRSRIAVWKTRSDKYQNRLRQQSIKIRDLQKSRDSWKKKSQQLQQALAEVPKKKMP